ncbi:MAG: apolipoprotein N-acyltransferase [Pseudomonadota bacterium]
MTERKSLSFVLALAGGAAFALGFAPTSWIWLALPAFGLLAVLIYNAASFRSALGLGYLFGAGQFLINFSWIANAFAVREGFSYAQGLAAVFALALGMAIYPAVAAASAWFIVGSRRSPWTFGCALSVFWTVTEIGRGAILTGFPWNPVGALWAASPIMAQLASVFGVFGLSLITVFIVSVTAAGLIASKTFMRRAMFVSAGVGGMALIAVYGIWRIPTGAAPVHPDLSLILVQANVPQDKKWDRALLESHLETHISLSVSAAIPTDHKRVVIWPETAYPYLIDTSRAAQIDLQQRLGADTLLLFGANRLEERSDRQVARNSLFALKDTNLVARYDKSHLVPFGEYVPYAGIFRLFGAETLVDVLSGFEPGPGPAVVAVESLPPFAPLICYEGIFPGMLTALEERPDWLLNISNDAWFGMSAGPYQHMNLARLRSIEQGIPLVRSTGTGVSSVFDPYGRKIASLPIEQKDVLISALPQPLRSKTFYYSTGSDSLSFIIALVILALGCIRVSAK